MNACRTLIKHAANVSSRRSFAGAKLIASQQHRFVTTTRAFSTTSTSQEDLFKLLTREHAEEIETDSLVMPPELSDLKSKIEADWTIVDDGAMTKMVRTAEDIKVQLSFHEEMMDEPVEEEAGPMRFTVTVSKAGHSLVFSCLAEDAQVRIQSVAITTEDVEAVHKNSGVRSSQYQGPEFGELAEDLQDGFLAFLEEKAGIEEDVSVFISMYTDYREQNEYVKFLEDSMTLLH
jgi:complement component 1 Q subcomponent-binding protein